MEQTDQWTDARVDDLKRDDVFIYPGETRPSLVTARWDHRGEVCIFSRDLATNIPQGKSALSPETPVKIRK